MPSLAQAIVFNHRSDCRSKALQLYHNFRAKSALKQWWFILTRRPRNLLKPTDIQIGPTAYRSCFIGLKHVPMHQIVGSQGRSRDFDRDFIPLQTHTKDRWIRIAAARLLGMSLPPVKLVQVGKEYFVKDGHHRISVAKALGQHEIEAEVTVLMTDTQP